MKETTFRFLTFGSKSHTTAFVRVLAVTLLLASSGVSFAEVADSADACEGSLNELTGLSLVQLLSSKSAAATPKAIFLELEARADQLDAEERRWAAAWFVHNVNEDVADGLVAQAGQWFLEPGEYTHGRLLFAWMYAVVWARYPIIDGDIASRFFQDFHRNAPERYRVELLRALRGGVYPYPTGMDRSKVLELAAPVLFAGLPGDTSANGALALALFPYLQSAQKLRVVAADLVLETSTTNVVASWARQANRFERIEYLKLWLHLIRKNDLTESDLVFFREITRDELVQLNQGGPNWLSRWKKIIALIRKVQPVEDAQEKAHEIFESAVREVAAAVQDYRTSGLILNEAGLGRQVVGESYDRSTPGMDEIELYLTGQRAVDLDLAGYVEALLNVGLNIPLAFPGGAYSRFLRGREGRPLIALMAVFEFLATHEAVRMSELTRILPVFEPLSPTAHQILGLVWQPLAEVVAAETPDELAAALRVFRAPRGEDRKKALAAISFLQDMPVGSNEFQVQPKVMAEKRKEIWGH